MIRHKENANDQNCNKSPLISINPAAEATPRDKASLLSCGWWKTDNAYRDLEIWHPANQAYEPLYPLISEFLLPSRKFSPDLRMNK